MLITEKRIRLKGFGEKNHFKIGLFGDAHIGDKGHSEDRFKKKVVNRINKYPSGSFAVSMGDLCGFTNTRSRVALQKALTDTIEDVHDALNGIAENWIDQSIKSLAPIEDKLAYFLKGNHGYDITDGKYKGLFSDEAVAQEVGAQFCDGMLILTLSISVSDTKSLQLNLVAHHGHGTPSSSRTPGGDINNVDKLSLMFSNAHIAAKAHTHQLSCTTGLDRFVIRNGYIKSFTPWLARTGSCVRGYMPGKASYAETKLLNPTSLGFVEFSVWLERDQSGGKDLIELHIDGRTVRLEPEQLVRMETSGPDLDISGE